MDKNKRKIGNEKEDKACAYLIKEGYDIIDRNFYTKLGELDIIAKDKNNICFIEVKYSNEKNGWIGAEAVTESKKKNIINTAKAYVLYKKLDPDDNYRFDVISIDGDNIRHYKGAF